MHTRVPDAHAWPAQGHNDDVYCLAFNPVTDHVVGVGKKFIRFFGVKEGVEEPVSVACTHYVLLLCTGQSPGIIVSTD